MRIKKAIEEAFQRHRLGTLIDEVARIDAGEIIQKYVDRDKFITITIKVEDNRYGGD